MIDWSKLCNKRLQVAHIILQIKVVECAPEAPAPLAWFVVDLFYTVKKKTRLTLCLHDPANVQH